MEPRDNGKRSLAHEWSVFAGERNRSLRTVLICDRLGRARRVGYFGAKNKDCWLPLSYWHRSRVAVSVDRNDLILERYCGTCCINLLRRSGGWLAVLDVSIS